MKKPNPSAPIPLPDLRGPEHAEFALAFWSNVDKSGGPEACGPWTLAQPGAAAAMHSLGILSSPASTGLSLPGAPGRRGLCCRRGHVMIRLNTLWVKKPGGKWTRLCRACRRASIRHWSPLLGIRRGPEHYKWKSDGVGYRGQHRRLGPVVGPCAECRVKPAVHWALRWRDLPPTAIRTEVVHGVALRYAVTATAYRALCLGCHRRYDDLDASSRRAARKAAEARAAKRQAQTHCKRGHPLAGDNVEWILGARHRRQCRACHRLVNSAAWRGAPVRFPMRSRGGEGNPAAKLTAAQTLEIRRLRAEGHLQRELADLFGVSRPAIHCVLSGKTWRPAMAGTA